MRKLQLVIFSSIIVSCGPTKNFFNPYGSWITADEYKEQKTFNIKKAPDNDIRVRQLGVPNSTFSQYAQDKKVMNSIVKFDRRVVEGVQSLTPSTIVFDTEDRSTFYFGNLNAMAFRISKSEKPEKEVLTEAIVRETKRRYPIRIKNWSSGRINGEAHRFKNVDVTLSSNGILSISGTQEVNSCKGFTGRMIVKVLDVNTNVLLVYEFSPHGLGPKWKWLNPCSKNTRSYNYSPNLINEKNLSPEEVQQLILGAYSLQVIAERKSDPKRVITFLNRIKSVGEELKQIGQTYGEIYALVNGIPVSN